MIVRVRLADASLNGLPDMEGERTDAPGNQGRVAPDDHFEQCSGPVPLVADSLRLTGKGAGRILVARLLGQRSAGRNGFVCTCLIDVLALPPAKQTFP